MVALPSLSGILGLGVYVRRGRKRLLDAMLLELGEWLAFWAWWAIIYMG